MFNETIICHYLTDTISDEENRQLRQWRDDDVDNEQTLKDYEKIWELAAIPEGPTRMVFSPHIGWLSLKCALSSTKSRNRNDEERKKQYRINKLPLKVKKFIKK